MSIVENYKKTKDIDVYEFLLIIYSLKSYIFFSIIISLTFLLLISKFVMEEIYETNLDVSYNITSKLNITSDITQLLENEELNDEILINQLIYNISSNDVFEKVLSEIDSTDYDKASNVLTSIDIDNSKGDQKSGFVVSLKSNSINLNKQMLNNLIIFADNKVTTDIIDYIDREISFKAKTQEMSKDKLKFEYDAALKRIKYEKKLIFEKLNSEILNRKLNLEENLKIAKHLGYENPQFNLVSESEFNLKLLPLYFYGNKILEQKIEILTKEIKIEQDFEYQISIIENRINNLYEQKKLESELEIFNLAQEIILLNSFKDKMSKNISLPSIDNKSRSNSLFSYNMSKMSSQKISHLSVIISLIISIGVGSVFGLAIGLFVREYKIRNIL